MKLLRQKPIRAGTRQLTPRSTQQQEILRRVEGLSGLGDQLELRLAKARGQVNLLTPARLALAFAGQLVPQDPTDEPVSDLLARI